MMRVKMSRHGDGNKVTLICCVNLEDYTLPVSVQECHELPLLLCVEIQPSEICVGEQ